MSEISEYRQRPAKTALAKKLGVAAWILSAVVLILVGAMQRMRFDIGFDTSLLPAFHAAVNASAAVTLIVALLAIQRGNVTLHKKAIFFAMGLSVLFLLSYVAYHISNEPTTFGGEGAIKVVYYLLLISHIVLAGVSLPFILFAFISGFCNQFDRHKKLVKYVFPMWLYVALTGPVCYFMLRPYY